MRYFDPDGRETKYTMTEEGKSFLKKLEGCVKNDKGLLIPYNDLNNNATKGYGILLHNGPLTEKDSEKNPPQTESEASVDFNKKLKEFETIVNNRTSYTFSTGEQKDDELNLSKTQADAIISLTYNSPKVGKKVIDAIRNGKLDSDVKTIWLDGYSETSGIGKRRIAEWNLYSEGKYE